MSKVSTPLYKKLAQVYGAYLNCSDPGHAEWRVKHYDLIRALVTERMPSGSGFDNGTKFDFDKSTPEKLVFITSFHHMDENGGYCGWTEHEIIVTPSLVFGLNLRVTGKNRNDIKDYISEVFYNALGTMIEE